MTVTIYEYFNTCTKKGASIWFLDKELINNELLNIANKSVGGILILQAYINYKTGKIIGRQVFKRN